jgi:hypothetical protein
MELLEPCSIRAAHARGELRALLVALDERSLDLLLVGIRRGPGQQH